MRFREPCGGGIKDLDFPPIAIRRRWNISINPPPPSNRAERDGFVINGREEQLRPPQR